MQLKTYQRATLDSLDRFLSRARAQGPAAAFEAEVKRQEEEARLEGRKLDKRLYKPMDGLPEVPKVCLRLPTGGGKTLLAAEAIRLAGRTYLARDYPLTIWFVTSTAIKAQTLDAPPLSPAPRRGLRRPGPGVRRGGVRDTNPRRSGAVRLCGCRNHPIVQRDQDQRP